MMRMVKYDECDDKKYDGISDLWLNEICMGIMSGYKIGFDLIKK